MSNGVRPVPYTSAFTPSCDYSIHSKESLNYQIPVGTAEASRTTVPFMYNLDEHVEGLDVVDFPGVDDEDDTIPDLADLVVTVAQIVIFVVDYR